MLYANKPSKKVSLLFLRKIKIPDIILIILVTRFGVIFIDFINYS